LRAAMQFKSQKAAEDWIHSPEGVDTIEKMVAEHAE